MANNKQYGLILPKKQQQKTALKYSNVFGDDNASDEDDGTDWVRKALKAEGEKNKIKKQTKLYMQKALNEDPTIYQYDEVYDNMERTKSQLDINKSKQKKPRYIENLLKTAERRKKEQEHRIERMVQKEREAEGETYADKESFVTSAYRAKLEEFKKMEEEEARMSRLEAIGDVTKQQDMSGFYRHLYEQTVECQSQNNDDECDKTKEDAKQKERENITSNINEINKDITRNKINNDETTTDETNEKLKETTKSKKSRQYRQRAVETYESDSEIETNKEELIKVQAIASSRNKDVDKSETKEPEKKKQKQDINDVETNNSITVTKNTDLNVKNSEILQDNKIIISESEKIVDEEKPVEKKDRSFIWKKRTVGPIFEAALQRYYARKAMRLTAI